MKKYLITIHSEITQKIEVQAESVEHAKQVVKT